MENKIYSLGDVVPATENSAAFIIRSVDFVTELVTIERIEEDPLAFAYFKRPLSSIRFNWTAARDTIYKLLVYAKEHSTGKHKVSKKCIARLETQLACI